MSAARVCVAVVVLGFSLFEPQTFPLGQVRAAQIGSSSDVPPRPKKPKSLTSLTPKEAKPKVDTSPAPIHVDGAACSVVNGVLGSGSLDWPGTTQTQATRLLRDANPSNCGSPKTYPGASGAGAFATDAYTFSNQAPAAQCVTVNFDPTAGGGACGTNVHAVVYLGSYDPNDVSANYLGDVGSSVAETFSFVVPAERDFIVVIAANNPGVGVGCTYQFTVVGDFCPGAVHFTNCYVDDVTGDTFSIAANPTVPGFGVWQYRVQATGQLITGFAETVTHDAGRLATASDQNTAVRMAATVDVRKKSVVVEVVDRPNFSVHRLSDANVSDDPPCR